MPQSRRRNWLRSLLKAVNRVPGHWRIAIFVALVCLVLVSLEVWRSWTDRDVEVAQAQAGMQNLARSLVQHVEDSVELADSAVVAVANRIQTNSASTLAAATAFQSSLWHRVANVPRLWNLSILDRDGNLIASSLPGPFAANQAGQSYFQYHLERNDERPHLGPPLREPSSGIWLLTVSRRFNDHAGQFAGVVVASLEVEYFAGHYGEFNMGQDGVVALFGPGAVLLARYPFQPEVVANTYVRSTLFSRDRSERHGVLNYVSPIDRTERIGGFARGRGFDLVVLAAVSRHEVLANWRTSLTFRIILQVALLALILGFGWWLARHAQVQQRLEQQHAQDARIDILTGLPNRRAFESELRRYWRRAIRLESSVAVLMLDLDRFKAYNDRYGHRAGDDCLRKVAEAVQLTLRRSTDFAARYGGEEIIILIADASTEDALNGAERVRLAIANLTQEHVGNEPFGVVTTSIGVACGDPVRQQPDDVIAAADVALYRAKSSGRNRVVIADRALQASAA